MERKVAGFEAVKVKIIESVHALKIRFAQNQGMPNPPFTPGLLAHRRLREGFIQAQSKIVVQSNDRT
ncbi:MAG TPA: hypothetical protein VKC54_04195 [Patescibacteria group bacterium]|nr:hypothetical protein [Patescibacteria group bacterium]